MGKYVEQKSVNTIVMAYLFSVAQTEDGSVPEDRLYEAFKGRIGSLRVKMAIEQLKEDKFIRDMLAHHPDYVWGLTPEGYIKAEEFYLGSPEGIVRTIADIGLDKYFEDRIERQKDGNEIEIPAADRYVTISDNMPGYGEIVATVEGADEALRGTNDLDANERSWIRLHIEAGLTLLRRGGKVLQSALKSLLLEPLETALKETTQENVKKAIEIALKAIRTYLGIF